MLMKLFDRTGDCKSAHAGAAHVGADVDAAVVVVVRRAFWEEGVEVFVGFFVSFWTKEVATAPAFPGSSG